MDNLLGVLPHVAVYFDDILVTGASDEDHWDNVCRVLGRLQEAGLRLKLAKCEFMKERVEYLGHVITSKGLHLVPRMSKQSSWLQGRRTLRPFRATWALLIFITSVFPDCRQYCTR